MSNDQALELIPKQTPTWKVLLICLGPPAIVVLAMIVFSIIYFRAPDRPDWGQNVASFEKVVAIMPAAPAGDEWAHFEVPPKIGDYEISHAVRVKSGVFFYDTTGCSLMDDAGFAYFPDGIDPDLPNGSFEAPQYKSLGGPWYSFCASW